jgi:hypothetical protein
MTHLYLLITIVLEAYAFVDIGDGILRAGSYSSSFCPVVGSGMHHFRFKGFGKFTRSYSCTIYSFRRYVPSKTIVDDSEMFVQTSS